MIVVDWLSKVIDKVNNYLRTATVGGVAYESTPNAWRVMKLGNRWIEYINYNTPLTAGGSFASDYLHAQDGSSNNYTKIKLTAHNKGSTNVVVKIQQSPNSTDWYDLPNQSLAFTSDGTDTLEVEVRLPWIRVVETNNDTNDQTENLVYVSLE